MLVAILLVTGDQPADETPAAAGISQAPSAPVQAAVVRPAAPPVAIVDSSPGNDDKDRLLALARTDRRDSSDDAFGNIRLEGPRPGPAPVGQVAESRVEREMSASEKAYQTARMVQALEDRARRVERRMEEARRSGDQDEARRQELIHWRLTTRVAALTERGEILARQAEEESEPSLEHGEGHGETHESSR